jgi:tetratricopeptide (TPR) repeat protein
LRDAEAACRRALVSAPENAEAHRLLGTVLRLQGRGVDAVAVLRRAVALDPQSAKAFLHLAISLAEVGRLSEALDADRRAIALRPQYPGALAHLARLKRFAPGDPDLAALEAADNDHLDEVDRTILLFALAKAFEDTGEFDRAFGYMKRANDLKRRSVDYRSEQRLAELRRIETVFDRDLLRRFAGAGCGSEVPILITGMPRSGTTLVEQILASHPAVFGAGELPHLHQLSTVVPLLDEHRTPFPEGVANLTAEDLAHLGHGYVARLRQLDPGAERVCDKQPLNFRHLGLAQLIVPNATLIHCVRDPLDTCLSCYSLNFGAVDFAYDLSELGEYYRAYLELMAHWRSVLPPGALLDVRYESLIADFEKEARRIVAHCGLPWDDACLSFYDAARQVNTASFAQVRQPIYTDSLARWRRYEKHLAPLTVALGDAASADPTGLSR